ncbi:MAG TPA: hypothetical protein VG799_00340 [Gemmatimonadota bacterium]|nr:hypothetical protein [Gemmatimonadota bacterium]
MARYPVPMVVDLSRFTSTERRIVERLSTPNAVQVWLRSVPYNWEATVRTFRGVVRERCANCLEAVLAAATILEAHGHPPLVLDLESQDGLDHVLYLFRERGRWGSIGKSRDVGLHGRRPVFRRVRDLVYSYVDPYVDGSGRIVGFAVFDLDTLTRADWRLGETEVPSVERALIAGRHAPLRTSDRRYERALARYRAFRALHPDRPVDDYPDRHRWM